MSSLTVGWMCTLRWTTVYGEFGGHDVEQGVHDLVALDAEQRRPEDQPRLAVDQHLHEAPGLAALAGAPDPRHRQVAHERRPARRAHLRLGHADAAQRRIGEQGVGRDAVGNAPGVAVEEVGGDDLEVVVRGVGECAPPVDVAQGPDALRAGPQLVVDRDVAPGVELHPRRREVEVLHVRPAPDRQQQVAAGEAEGLPSRERSTRTPPSRRDTRKSRAPRWIAMPSASRTSRTASDTSGSSRAISRSAYSRTVTREPNRRYICANSRPT